MPIFTPHKLALNTELPAAEVKQKLQLMMEQTPAKELNIVAGDLQYDIFELRWQPQNKNRASLTVEGTLQSDMDGTDVHLQIMLEPSHQVNRLIWLGFLGLLFFVTLFGPPPAWSSIFPLGAMIMLYFGQEQRFTDSVRNMRAVLCEQFEAEVVEG
jgi:hypothetical protein